MSDLHLEKNRDLKRFKIPEIPSDVIILAGDIAEGIDGIEWAAEQSARLRKPIIYVPGNHEFYGTDMHSTLFRMRQKADQHGINVLSQNQIIIDNVRFLGVTLWTDYGAISKPERSMEVCQQFMNDHRLIRFKDKPFTTQTALNHHQSDIHWLESKLRVSFDGKTVVVTHHGPSIACHDNNKFDLDEISAGFWSHLDHLLPNADLWVYGHTHGNLDRVVNGTRLFSNQCGYRHSIYAKPEVKGFNANLIVEI
jgi:predicted phosphodiesterase